MSDKDLAHVPVNLQLTRMLEVRNFSQAWNPEFMRDATESQKDKVVVRQRKT